MHDRTAAPRHGCMCCPVTLLLDLPEPLAVPCSSPFLQVGHAVCGTLTPGHDPVQKVTLIPRGQARGLTWFIPGELLGPLRGAGEEREMLKMKGNGG